MYIDKLEQFFYVGLPLGHPKICKFHMIYKFYLIWSLSRSKVLSVKGHWPRDVAIFLDKIPKSLVKGNEQVSRNHDPNGSWVAAYRFFFKSLTESHSVLQRKKWRLLLNESFFKLNQTAELLAIGQFRSKKMV